MGSYKPLKITGMASGLIQEREEFLIPDDAYPTLENAFIWRERIKRKQGFELLGRLQRNLTAASLGMTDGSGDFTGNLITSQSLETNSSLVPGTIMIIIGSDIFSDANTKNGILVAGTMGSGVINYSTGIFVITGAPATTTVTSIFSYNPNLPVMGLRTRELNSVVQQQLVAFDTKYAYIFTTSFQEFIPGTIWTGTDSNFFWSTNYWVDTNTPPNKLFWVTNYSGQAHDPIRYTNGIAWFDFGAISATGTGLIDAVGNYLNQSLCLLPFRGRLVAFNTLEGPSLAGSTIYSNRIRWAAIGNPLFVGSAGPPITYGAWRDDVRGRGGFLDIPTSESIVSVGFVRDNLVVYCENSTWQLRYTGRSIAPFQIEKVNTELGSQSTFSAIQFDTSLVGIGDKGVVECDSYKSERIDVKIPDLTFQFSENANGNTRVHGIRDFQQKLAYWTYPYAPSQGVGGSTYPNRRLVYNYENDAWAIFTDSFTCFGTYQPQMARRWQDCNFTWEEASFPWVEISDGFPALIGGNQQGYVEYLSSNLQPRVSNDQSLYINAITGNNTNPTVITSINHNMQTGQVIEINNIPTGTPFASTLNGNKFGIVALNVNQFQLWIYNPKDQQFTTPKVDTSSNIYIGYGTISLRDGFSIISKKFNFLDEGQNIQLGYVDALMNNTSAGAVTLNIYLNYADEQSINTLPQNIVTFTQQSDDFFNSVVPTTAPTLVTGVQGSKNWQRVYCPCRGNFITLEWTLSNAQLIGVEQESDVQIDAQILWLRQAGRMTNI